MGSIPFTLHLTKINKFATHVHGMQFINVGIFLWRNVMKPKKSQQPMQEGSNIFIL